MFSSAILIIIILYLLSLYVSLIKSIAAHQNCISILYYNYILYFMHILSIYFLFEFFIINSLSIN